MTIALMGTVNLDVITIFDRVFTDLFDGDSITVTYPNELMTMKTGKNGNTIYMQDETGKNVDILLRLVLGSPDDIFLRGKLFIQNQTFISTVLATGRFSRQLGDGLAGGNFMVTELAGGAFSKDVDIVSSSDKNIEAFVAIYNMKFALASTSAQ
jgi:hypothetical protein